MSKIQEVLSQLNYRKLKETEIYWISLFLSKYSLPKDKYSIKKLANNIKENIKFIDIKKSHSIELVSRVVFNEKWHVLSKKIPNIIRLTYNLEIINYGNNIIMMSNIRNLIINDFFLEIELKDSIDKILIIHPDSKKLSQFIKDNPFSGSLLKEYLPLKFRPLNDNQIMKILNSSDNFNKKRGFLKKKKEKFSINKLYDQRYSKNYILDYESSLDSKKWGRVNKIIQDINNRKVFDTLIISENGYEIFNYDSSIILALYILGYHEIEARVVSEKVIINSTYYIVATEDQKDYIIKEFKESFNKKEGIVYHEEFQDALNIYIRDRNKLSLLEQGLHLVIFKLDFLGNDLNNIGLSVIDY